MTTMDEWRRELLRLMQIEREARERVNQHLDPLPAERAYADLCAASADLDRHYKMRPEYA